MKVIAVGLARCMWVIDFNKVNPRGRSYLEAFHAIGQRYRFSKFPAHLMDFNAKQGLEFTAGTFRTKDGTDLRVGLTVFNDGLVGDTMSSTDDADAFLADLRDWAAKEHNLVIEDEAILRKAYVSQLEVKMDRSLVLNPKLDNIARKLSEQCLTIDGKPREFFFAGIRFWSDDIGKDNAPLAFWFENKWGTHRADNIYFTQAQLTTQQHTELLEELERALS